MSHVLIAETGHINFSPVGFRRAAEDFLSCYEAFKPATFSVIPYFLCCRAVELALKAIHLESKTQKDVKDVFWHDLKASYDALPEAKKTLQPSELLLLDQTNRLYTVKAFEYVQPGHAANGYDQFPVLEDLAQLARTIVSMCR